MEGNKEHINYQRSKLQDAVSIVHGFNFVTPTLFFSRMFDDMQFQSMYSVQYLLFIIILQRATW